MTIAQAAGRAVRPAVAPELSEFPGQFLTGHAPVVPDAVAQLGHVPFELQLILLEPRHVELLARSAPLELSGDVLVVVTDDPGDAHLC